MRNTVLPVAWLTAVSCFSRSLATAAPLDNAAIPYQLEERSTYEDGCYGPCDCAVLQRPMRGSFLLERTMPDPLYDNYAVTNVKWVVPASFSGAALEISGSGKYRVGGEFAVMHQLSLDLSVGGDPPVHFDSDLVQGGGDFPRIDIVVSRHGMTACRDTVLHVVAAPATADIGGSFAVFGLRRAVPNPFRGSTTLELRLRNSGPVDVDVFDVRGRAVRTLASGQWLVTGRQDLHWNGLGTREDDLPPGLYFARVRADGREYRRAIVKLR